MGLEEAAYTAIFPAALAIAACPVAGGTRHRRQRFALSR